MNFLLWHRDSAVGIAATRRVLRADEVPLLVDANALCQRLQALHGAETARLDAVRHEAAERGYAAGLQEGAEAASEAHADRLAALTAAAARQRETLRAQVAELALQVARKMIGSLADDERLIALGRTAARDLVPGGMTALLVHPDRVEAVRDRLALLAADAGSEPLPAWDVRADGELALDSCRIETELGTVDATLDTQMRRLADAWGIGTGRGSSE